MGIFRRNKAHRITVTSINLRYMGETHSLSGKEVREKVFEVYIPFQNKLGNDLLPDNLKGPGMSVSRITVAPPFELVSASPRLPVQIDYMSKVIFTLRVKAPDVTYEGPLVVSFGNEQAESVNLNLKAINLHSKGRSLELENSGMIINMQKGQIFKRSVQLYKIFSFGDRITGIEVNDPFGVVSTEPALPLSVDKKDSFILGIYLKAPDFNYAGTVEITFR